MMLATSLRSELTWGDALAFTIRVIQSKRVTEVLGMDGSRADIHATGVGNVDRSCRRAYLHLTKLVNQGRKAYLYGAECHCCPVQTDDGGEIPAI